MFHVLIGIGCLVLLCWTALLVAYRLPSGAPEPIEGEVLYKFVDLSGDLRTAVFEAILRNRRLWLVDGRSLYVDAAAFRSLWAESPHRMAEQGRTKYVLAAARPLLFGGYGLASIKEIRSLAKPPEGCK